MDKLGKIRESSQRKDSTSSTIDRQKNTNIVKHSTPVKENVKENPKLNNVEDDNEDGQSLFSKEDTKSLFDIKRFQDSINIT